MAATPTKLVIACPTTCSLHPDAIGVEKAELLLRLRESGAGQVIFMRQGAEALGRPIAAGTAQRHLKHYRLSAVEQAAADADEAAPKPTDLEILDSIITAGFRVSKSWRPSIKDTLDAMKMKLQLTGNSAFENMLDAMALAASDEDEEGEAVEDTLAALSEAERPDDDSEDLAEPLY